MRLRRVGSIRSTGSPIIQELIMISNRSKITTAVLLASLVALASCGNTIRGVGRDTASAVGATKSAAHNVAKAAQ